ncbi:MAG: hypothetical protein ACODAQ_02855 [Phycisphaeraceae bacterium]
MHEPDPAESKGESSDAPRQRVRVTWALPADADDAPPSTQVVVLVWCLWLAGAWGVSMLLSSSVVAARWLVVTSVVGLMLVWPAARLSEGRERVTMPGVLVEWLCLVLVFQAVIWPLRIISDWRMDQTAWLDGAVAAWSLLTAAVVAMGMQFRGAGARMAAMVLCVLVVLGEPMVLALAATVQGAGTLWEMRLTPLPTVWALAQPIADVSLGAWPARIMVVGVAAVAAWVAVGVVMAVSGRGRRG